MASNDFYKELTAFAQKLEKGQTQRRKTRLDQKIGRNDDAPVIPQQGLTFSPDVQGFLSSLRQHVTQQKNRYALAETPIGLSPEAAAPVAAPVSAFTQDIQQKFAAVLQPRVHEDVPDTLDPRVRHFAGLLEEEMANLTNEATLAGSNGAVIIPRLRQAKQAIFADRMQDAVTIMRTAYKNNPHSHLLLYLLSQFLYLMHGMGQQNCLPEARELAQKSTIVTDKVGPEKLLRYRFHAIVTELGQDPARALDWLRDTGLLEPSHLKTKHGWLSGNGFYLLSWVAMADVPASAWSDAELIRLNDLAHNLPGGLLLYWFYFRPFLTAEAASRKTEMPVVGVLEKDLNASLTLYTDIAVPMAQLAQQPQTAPWTVRNRFIRAVAGVAPTPGFDHVLLHIAIDGHSVAGGYPDLHLRAALEDANLSYWNLWAGSLAADREARQSHLLPMAETLEDQDLLVNLATLMNTLHGFEQKLVKPGWADVQPWMTRWQLDHILALGTGSSRPRSRFAPALAPYSTYYRRWSEPVPGGVLPSEMIAENARRGGFASLFEVQSTLEGTARLLVDPVHGLIPAQKRALLAAKKANPSKFKHLSHDVAGSPLTKMLFLTVLLAGGVGAAVRLTENIGQAIGLSLVIAGFIGILAVQMAKPKLA